MAPRKASTLSERPNDVLAAVLLADSFTQRFRPMTVERPKVLLPLVNVAMIDYTLEWLVMNGVAEIYVFCCAHAEQVVEHLGNAGWLSHLHCHVQTVVSPGCLSAGDALRAIDQKDIIKGDFVLLTADTVANFNLGPVLALHKARREKDKNAIMTMVMRDKVDYAQRKRRGERAVCVAVDPSSLRLLRYQDMSLSKRQKVMSLDTHLFGERDAVQVRSDAADCEIYICSPEVLLLFSDNFDYQNVRPDFISGVLSEEELGNKLYVHVLDHGYAGRVYNLRSYDAISRDILQRWTFPFVPDSNLGPPTRPWGPPSFRLTTNFVYTEEAMSAARSVILGHDTCVGSGTTVDADCKIETSVIGRNCRIGRNVTLVGSYVQDGVIINENAVIMHSMICSGCVVLANAVIRPGCLLSYKVVIGAGSELPSYTRITLCRQKAHGASFSDDELEVRPDGAHPPVARGYEEDDVQAAGSGDKPPSYVHAAAEALALGRPPQKDAGFDVKLVGDAGAGYAWVCQNREDVDVENFSLAPPPPSEPVDGDAASESSSSSTEFEVTMTDPEVVFSREVAETFLRCVKDGYGQELAAIELNGLKIAEDRTFADLARYIFIPILMLCLPPSPAVRPDYRHLYPTTVPDTSTAAGRAELVGGSAQEPEGRLGRLLNKWTPLLRRFLKSEDDQVELLLTFEEFCSGEGVYENSGGEGSVFTAVFPQVLKMLYDKDVVDEKAFLDWADEKEHAEEHERVFLAKAARFITWLREAEEEDDEETEEDSDASD